MTADNTLQVLIVDDEEAARHRLEDLLAHEENTEVVGQATNGREAIQAIERLAPDLVFLDVQMPGLTGIDVVREVGPEHMPAVIFATAYDQYAIDAFDMAAVDYLLKPYDDERFEQALARARERLATQSMENVTHRLKALLSGESAPESTGDAEPHYLERIGVDMRGQMRIVPVDRIDFITASGPYAELHVGEDTFVIRERMKVLEERLDPRLFYRIHRSTIVQLDRIESLKYSSGGEYAVRLRDGRHLRVSRGRYEELQQRLGLDDARVE